MRLVLNWEVEGWVVNVSIGIILGFCLVYLELLGVRFDVPYCE